MTPDRLRLALRNAKSACARVPDRESTTGRTGRSIGSTGIDSFARGWPLGTTSFKQPCLFLEASRRADSAGE
jgi:hypothetical protein